MDPSSIVVLVVALSLCPEFLYATAILEFLSFLLYLLNTTMACPVIDRTQIPRV
jgi:acetyl esterase/lipase